MSLTRDLGRFVADASFEPLPAEAVDVARTGFTDCIATMIAGANDPAPQLLRRALNPSGDGATLYSPASAALRLRRHGSTAPPHMRSIMTTWQRCAVIRAPWRLSLHAN
jgi:2-methylcitrate dehydratase PrpD